MKRESFRRSNTPSHSGDEMGHAAKRKCPQRGQITFGFRLVVVAAVPLLLLVVAGVFAAYLQIVHHGVYYFLAERGSHKDWQVPFERGAIQGRHGTPLALSVDVDTIKAEPRSIDDPLDTAHRLAEVLGLDRERLYGHLIRPAGEELIKDWLNPQERRLIEELGRSRELAIVCKHEDVLFVGRCDLYAYPSRIEDPRVLANQLSPILSLESEKLYEKLTIKAIYAGVKRRVSAKESRLVRAMRLKGVNYDHESGRFYPYKSLAGQLLGFVRYDSVGQSGVERLMEPKWRGPTESIRVFRNRPGDVSFLDFIPEIPDFVGHTAVLTIDEHIQREAERLLEETTVLSAAGSGLVAVMDVKTGELLAAAQMPRYNPNVAGRASLADRQALLVSDAFEPGSVMKTFTLAAALELGVVTMDDMLDLERRRYRVATTTFRDSRDAVNVWDAIKYSSNIGFIKLGELVGREQLHATLTAFGFGSPPGLGLAGEAAGTLHDLEEWYPVTFANITFGQGLAATPLQLVRAMAAIGNDGVLMRPLLVRELSDYTGKVVKRYEPRVERRVLSPETAALVQAGLARSLEAGGTGRPAASARFDLLGKTGTAHQPDDLEGGYKDWRSVFLGLAPAREPRIAVLVVINRSHTRASGGRVAGPLFRDISEWTLDYLGVAPDRGETSRIAFVRPGDGLHRLRAVGAHQDPDWPDPEDALVDLDESVTHTYVPDLTGMTMRRARDRAHRARLEIDLAGSGIAIMQYPAPGARVPVWSKVQVSFSADVAQASAAEP